MLVVSRHGFGRLAQALKDL
ncbi:hypothetical protein [Actinomadura madurae]